LRAIAQRITRQVKTGSVRARCPVTRLWKNEPAASTTA
jgi:hypothetical protein